MVAVTYVRLTSAAPAAFAHEAQTIGLSEESGGFDSEAEERPAEEAALVRPETAVF